MIRRVLIDLLPPIVVGLGVGWWIHPGAGLAAAALIVCVDNLLPDPKPVSRRRGGA